MFVGVCKLVLIASHCHSLKEKRSVVRKIKDRVRGKYGLPVSEVGGQETWQRIVVGFAVVAGEHARVDGTIDKVIGFIESMGVAELVDVGRDVLTFADDDPGLREGGLG